MLLRAHAIRVKPHAFVRLPPVLLDRRSTAARFCTESARPGGGSKMESKQEQQPCKSNGDEMSDSFGVGYFTRSDDEGFGGVYGGNQSHEEHENAVHENAVHETSPEYDGSEGSEAKVEEKAQNQDNATTG